MPRQPLLSNAPRFQRRARPPTFSCSHFSGGLDAAWVHVAGELDISTTPILESKLADLEPQTRLVVVDLRQVEFVDSAGVHVLANATSRARSAGRRMVVVRNPATMDRVLTLTGAFENVDSADLHPAEPPVQVLLQLAAEDAAELRIDDMADGRTVVRTAPADLAFMLDECDVADPDRPRARVSRPVRAVGALASLLGLRKNEDQARRADWLGGPSLDEYTLSGATRERA